MITYVFTATRLSREDYKKAKELEELRKTGAAPPELDEDGKMINPHIPQYISAAPWYLNNNRPGLKHQRTSAFGSKESFSKLDEYYDRTKKGKVNAKWKKGACENCGATTHKTKDCVERPRRKGAKLTNKNICADETIESFNLDFDGKRDRWNGYNPNSYKQVIQRFEKTEAERREKKKKELDEKFKMKKERKEQRRKEREQRREEKLKKKQEERKKRKEEKAKAAKAAGKELNESDESSDSEWSDTDTDTDTDDEEDDEDVDNADLKDDGELIQKRSDHSKFTTNRTTARNLRIREDTAKYLRNLNIHSAHYDPKTRSMRENPHPEKDPKDLMYAGDNFMRKSGDTQEIAKLQLFVWDAAAKGGEGQAEQDIHVLANPSQAELMFEQFKQKKEALKSKRSSEVLAKYGGSEHMNAPPKELLVSASESYVEYSETGEVIKGQEAMIPKTKYIEDVFENNHTSVWGSFWKDGKWGYACCHSTMRSAYCTGAAGKHAVHAIKEELTTKKALPPVPKFGTTKRKNESQESSDSAFKRPKNKMGYNCGSQLNAANPTDKEMEEYYKAKSDAFNDPMRNMKDYTSDL